MFNKSIYKSEIGITKMIKPEAIIVTLEIVLSSIYSYGCQGGRIPERACINDYDEPIQQDYSSYPLDYKNISSIASTATVSGTISGTISYTLS